MINLKSPEYQDLKEFYFERQGIFADSLKLFADLKDGESDVTGEDLRERAATSRQRVFDADIQLHQLFLKFVNVNGYPRPREMFKLETIDFDVFMLSDMENIWFSLADYVSEHLGDTAFPNFRAKQLYVPSNEHELVVLAKRLCPHWEIETNLDSFYDVLLD